MIEQSGEQVQWNMGALLNFELAKLRARANDNYISGNYLKAFTCLEAIEQTQIQLMEAHEREKLKDLKKNLRLLCMAVQLKGSFNKEVTDKAKKVEIRLKELYDDYNEFLQDTLDKYGVFGGRKMDATRMKI